MAKPGNAIAVHVSQSEVRQDVRGTVRDIRGTVVGFGADPTYLELNLQGVDFNSDEKSAAYLVCEFPNGERYSFYLSRSN